MKEDTQPNAFEVWFEDLEEHGPPSIDSAILLDYLKGPISRAGPKLPYAGTQPRHTKKEGVMPWDQIDIQENFFGE